MPLGATPPSDRPDVAVVVVSWNTRELLGACLDSLRADAHAGLAQVWVIDNASADGSAEMVRRRFGWVRLVSSSVNLGFGAAVNLGAVHSADTGTPWLAAANADVALAPGALRALVDAGRADVRAGAVAPALRLGDGSLQYSAHPFPSLHSATVVALGLAGAVPALGERLTLDGHWDRARPRRVDWAHGAFLLLRRRAFDAVGGFDPEQFLYAEDLDLAWRLRQAGWHTRYAPGAVVDHAHGAAIAQFYGDRRDLEAQRSALAWLLRRRGATVMRTWSLINTLGAGARIPGSGARGLRGGFGAGPDRHRTRLALEGLLAPQSRLTRQSRFDPRSRPGTRNRVSRRAPAPAESR